jgi:hypothetical protein
MFDDKKRKRKTQHPTGMEENSRRKEFGFLQLAQHFNAGLSVGAMRIISRFMSRLFLFTRNAIFLGYLNKNLNWRSTFLLKNPNYSTRMLLGLDMLA